ncbi:MAG: NifB/NifX family molybdenum-iron cluster-binding protein [Desulfatitalea sp.]
MSTVVIAVPSEDPGGLDAPLGAHFGHCALYTIVDVKDGAIHDVRVVPNVPHQEGGCLAPVQYLAGEGVQQLIAGGMGLRPLMGFNQVGIQVLHGGDAHTVGEAVQSAIAGKLPQFQQMQTCGGCGEH